MEVSVFEGFFVLYGGKIQVKFTDKETLTFKKESKHLQDL